MTATASFKVHRVVEYLKVVGFDFETDEVEDLGPQEILCAHYGLQLEFSGIEVAMLREEMLQLAEENELREALHQTHQLMPEDSGVELFRGRDKDGSVGASYTVPYSYPVDRRLREIWAGPRGFFSLGGKEAPENGALEVDEYGN